MATNERWAGDSAMTDQGRGRLDGRAALWTALLLAVLLVAWWWAAERYREDRIARVRTDVGHQAAQYASGLSAAIGPRGKLAEGLADFVAAAESTSALSAAMFDTFAAGQFSSGSGIRTIQVAPGGVIRWTYPLKGNEQAVGLDILNHPDGAVRADVRRTWDTGSLTVSAPFELAQGGSGIALRRLVTVNGGRWGIAAVVMDLPPVIEEAGLRTGDARYLWAVRDGGGRVFAGDRDVLGADPITADVRLPDGHWTVLLAPAGGWDALVSQDAGIFRLALLAIVGLITLSAYLLISRQRRLEHLVTQRTADLAESERRARALFERSPVSLWQEDFSAVKERLDALRSSGVADVRAHLREHPEMVDELVRLIGIADVNAATLGLYDAASKKELLAGLGRYATAESHEVFAEQMIAIAEGRTEFWGDTAMLTPTGRVRYVAVRWTVMPGHEDDYRSVVVSVIDLTDQVLAQRQLNAIRENLEELVERRTSELIEVNRDLVHAQQAKDAFLANMSHELRTPLNSVLGFTGVMLQEIPGPLNDEQRRQLDMVRRSGRQLLALVNDVLDLAKVEAGRVGIEPVDVEIREFTHSVADLARPLMDDTGLDFAVEAGDEPLTIRTDRDRVAQVLMNLLTNAAKFAPAGRVTLEAAPSDGGAVFIVSDTGPGIPPESRDAIFRPFYQLPSTASAKSAGTGLGLAIARDLAVMLGGELTVGESDAGGARFELRLPARPPQDGDA